MALRFKGMYFSGINQTAIPSIGDIVFNTFYDDWELEGRKKI